MREVKKLVYLVLTVVVMMSLLGACKKADVKETVKAKQETKDDGGTKENESRQETKAESDKQNPVTLTTVSFYSGSDAKAPIYQEFNKKFMNDYPYITIEDDSQVSDQDWKTRIAADFAVGNEPDVLLFFTDANASDVLAADKFVTIEEIKAEYPDYAKDTLPAALAEVANLDGVQRAVPTVGFWEGLFCNKDLFDRYDLELPTDWDKMLKAIETFKENDIIPISVSLNNVPNYWIEYLMLVAAGPEGYATVPQSVPEDWVKGLEMFKTLRDLGAFPVDTDTIDDDFARELFKNKQAAMELEGSWYIDGIPDQDNTVVVSFPIFPGGKAAPGTMVAGLSSGFYITKRAWNDPDKRDAAVKFVMTHTSSEAVQKYWNGNGRAAAKVELLADMTPLGFSGLEYSRAATNIVGPTDSRIKQEAYNILVRGIVDISTGARTPEDLLQEVLDINANKLK